jgi:hypothetical protein
VETVPALSSHASVCLLPGYKYRARASSCSSSALCDCLFLSLPSSIAPCRRRRPFPHRLPNLTSTLMVGKSQVLTADVWICSSVMERRLEELVRDGLLRPRINRSQSE